jgi:hypothetical protein
MSLTADIVMQLIEGYAESRHKFGAPEYNETTALSRKVVRSAIEALVEAATPKTSLLANYSDQMNRHFGAAGD